MKSIKSFFVLCSIMFISLLYAANETPMQLFKNLREAAINNDTATALLLTDGELLAKIKGEGTFPGDLRMSLLFTSAAFEDVHVRKANPENAEIHAFLKRNGKLEYLNIQLKKNENSVMKIVSITPKQYLADPFLAKFLAACRANSFAQYNDLITPELAKKYKTIPESFKASAQENIIPGKHNDSSATFAIERYGIRGDITMVKDGYFWKVASIDSILTALLPDQVVKNLSNAAKNAKKPDDLNDFFLKNSSALKKLNEKEISRFAGLSSINNQTPLAGKKFKMEAKINSEAETGIISIELAFEDNSWKVSAFNSSLVFDKNFAPETVVKKFIDVVIKNRDFESDDAKAVIPHRLLDRLNTQITEPSPELTFNIANENITGNRASIAVSVQKSKVVEKINFTLVLDAAKWKIQDVKLTAPAPENKQPDPGSGDISTHE